ncbi:hypothetical protein C1646_767578 [Rhizophagus diaphanus]|nr:hypothetical protein C1646_767578 [Rhizophagus diaphanus] [Rhizophagus sp. MUCL 43196]
MKRHEWQAYRKLEDEELEKNDFEIIYYRQFINPQWAKSWEKDYKMKGQDELIGIDGICKKRTGINRFKVPAQTISKSRCPTCPLSTMPKSKEEHEELDDLNDNFSRRLEDTEKTKVDSKEDGKNKDK